MKKIYRKISIILLTAFLMLSPISTIKILARNLIYTSAEILEDHYTVRFSMKYDNSSDNPTHAYVVGDFSNWQENEIYKLTWKDMGNNDWKIVGDIPLTPGKTYKYKFKIAYNNATHWVDPTGGNPADSNNATITLPLIENQFTLKSSSNKITQGSTVEFAADLYKNDGVIEVMNPNYTIEPAIQGVMISSDGVLSVNQPLSEGQEIAVVARENGLVSQKKIVYSNDNHLKDNHFVHYYRYDNDYSKWDVWAWKDNASDAFGFNEETDFGRVANVEDKNSAIVRKEHWSQQEVQANFENTKNIYYVENDRKTYTNFREAVNATKPKVNAAIMDSLDEIKAYLTHIPNPNTKFKLTADNNGVDGVTFEREDKVLTLKMNGHHLDPSKHYQVEADRQFNSASVVMRNVLDSFGTDETLGVQYSDAQITLNLWAPTAKSVQVVLYDKNEDLTGTIVPLEKINNVWTKTINRSYYGKYYLYEITFANGTKTLAMDPYATAVGLNGDKGYLVDIKNDEETKASISADKPELLKPEDAIIYEMHIRDFTIGEHSGVVNKGKFLGVVEEGKTVEKDGVKVSTGLDHLKELGITHVHLLPVYDYASVKEEITDDSSNRNWGYDPKNYNALEGSYSTNPSDPKVRIKEFREMVNKLHANNIRVVLDVVYNHMYKTEYMDKVVPGYFFRSDRYGNYTNGSGTGNEMATERRMVSKFIVDSTKHWTEQYNIDGLRFDLMELIDLNTMKKVTKSIQAIDATNIIYGEPWKAADTPLESSLHTVDGTQRGQGFSMFNDNYRDAVRGDNAPGKGFVNGVNNEEINNRVKKGIAGAIDDFTSDPQETINYVEVHDNYTIFDQIIATVSGHNNQKSHYEYLLGKDKNTILSDDMTKRIMLSQAMIFTSQGIPLMHSGTEFLRTKYGDHNSYKSDDSVNKLLWENKPHFSSVFDYQKGLIQLRKAHPAFRMTSAEMIRQHLHMMHGSNDGNVIITKLVGNANNDTWKNIVVVYNPTNQDYDVKNDIHQFAGNANWKVVVDDKQAGVSPISGYDTNLIVRAHSALVLYDEEAKQDNLSWNYLYSDQSEDYMSPMEPTENDEVTLRFRAKANEVTNAYLHYYDMNHPQLKDQKVEMKKVVDQSFYTAKGYDSNEVEFWEVTLAKSATTRYYNFEVYNRSVSAWISGGNFEGSNNNGVSSTPKQYGDGIDYGFRIVPNYQTPTKNKESILYQIMVDRFRNGDVLNDRSPLDPAVGVKPFDYKNPSEILKVEESSKSGDETDHIWNNDFYNGDLTGVKEALPYLKEELGVTGLYLMPIFQSESNHKYDVTNFDFVDKNFGGNLELAGLTKSLHDNDMSIILDGVFNHTGSLHEWLKAALDLSNPNHSIYQSFYFTKENEKNVPEGYYGWKGFGSLPKLQYATDEVKNVIYRNEDSVVKKYLKAPYFIDGWRLDAAEDVSENATEYENKQQIKNPEHIKTNLKIWEEVRTAIKQTNPNASIIGEYWGDNAVWFDGNHWDGKMNYSGFYLPFIQNRQENSFKGMQSLDNNGAHSVADIAKFARNEFKKYPYTSILNSTNSISTHDRPRFLDWNYTGKNNEQMMELAATLQMTQVGIPMIYYGDEVGMYSKKQRNQALDQGNDPYNRDAFNWNRDTWNKEMLSDYKSLIAIRKKLPHAFVYGAMEELKSHHQDKYLVYARHGNGQKAVVVLNNNANNASRNIQIDDIQRLGFKDGDVLVDLLSDKEVIIHSNTMNIVSDDMHAAVYVLKENDITSNVDNVSLNDEKDQREMVKSVDNVHLEDKTLSWDEYSDERAKNLLVRAYDANNNVVFEKEIEKNSTSVEIDAEFEFVAIKAIANRTQVKENVDDVYMDSYYRLPAIKKYPVNENVGVNDNIEFTLEDWKIEDYSSVVLSGDNPIDSVTSVENGKLIINPNIALNFETTYTINIPATSTSLLKEKGFSNAEISNVIFKFKTLKLEDVYESTKEAVVPSTHVKVSFELGEGITSNEALKVYHVRKGTKLPESNMPSVTLADDYKDLVWTPTLEVLNENTVYKASATRLEDVYESTKEAVVPSTHVKVSFELGEGITPNEALKVYHVRKGIKLPESNMPSVTLADDYKDLVWTPTLEVLNENTVYKASATRLEDVYESTKEAVVPSTHVKVSFELGEGITPNEALKVYHVRKGTKLPESNMPSVLVKPGYENLVWNEVVDFNGNMVLKALASKMKISSVTTSIDNRHFVVMNQEILFGSKLVVDKVVKTINHFDYDYEIFDIYIEYNGKKLEISTPTKVTITKEKEGKNVIGVKYLKEDGTLINHEFIQDNQSVTFETNHFSEYVIVYEKETNGIQPIKKGVVEEKDNAVIKPQVDTVDLTSLYVFMFIISMGCILFLLKSQREN